ncbi:MAG: GNAT family N-acetyltransferase [Pseudomonadota bacterium]
MSTVYSFTIPTLETERLALRGWHDDDHIWLGEIFSDEETTRFIGGVQPPHEAWRRLSRSIGHWHLRGFGLFVVTLRASGEPVGYCGPMYPDGWPEPEIGWTFIKRHHGQGYATEAARRALRFAYEELGWETAISLIDDDNIASERVAGKLGASYESTADVTDFTARIFRHLPPSQFLNS